MQFKDLGAATDSRAIIIDAPPSVIFAIYRDIENWKSWDEDVKKVVLSDGLKVGSQGEIMPTKGPTAKVKIISVGENRNFTVQSKSLLFCVNFEHELIELEGKTKVIHRAVFSGLLKRLFSKIIGEPLKLSLPDTLQNIKKLAEKPV